MCFHHTIHRSRHAHRKGAGFAKVGEVIPAGVQVHVAVGEPGCALAEVQGGDRTVGHMHHHEAPAAEVAGSWECDGECELYSDGCVDGVSALLEDVPADLGGYALGRDH